MSTDGTSSRVAVAETGFSVAVVEASTGAWRTTILVLSGVCIACALLVTLIQAVTPLRSR